MVGWIADSIKGFFASILDDLNQELFSVMYSAIEDTVIQPTNPSQYIVNFDEILHLTQAFSLAMLTIFVITSVFRQLSGVMYQGDKSMGQYILDMVMAGSLIFLLPLSVTKIMIPLNNLVIDFLGNIGITKEGLSVFLGEMGEIDFTGESITYVLLCLVTSLAFVVFAVLGGIRYIETLLVILISPFFGLSALNGSDGIQVWSREAISIVFTQSIHFLMLIFIGSVLNGVPNFTVSVLLTTGAVVVAFKGPQILRQYLYRTGTSSAMVSGAGSAGRLAAMRVILK